VREGDAVEHADGRVLPWRIIALIGGAVVVVAAIAGGLVLARRSGSSRDATEATVPLETTTTQRVPDPIAPLTGLEDPSGAVAHRCAVTVKVGNTREAHPQYGISAADVVYEEVVEGGITRLAAVYNSQAPDKVGSVRSVRPTDQSIVWPLKGVFAFSGGNSYELASIAGAPVTKLDETTAGPTMFRESDRPAPHNLYARVDQMYDRCEDPSPQPLFTYRSLLTLPVGEFVSSMTVGFGRGYDVSWNWDQSRAAWTRAIFGAPDTASDGTQLGVANVVVMQVVYVPDASRTTTEADMVGRGPVSVFSSGYVVTGDWVRPDKNQPAQLIDASGQPIVLTPGQTWVELLPVGSPISLLPG
jgi:hypothetical protein